MESNNLIIFEREMITHSENYLMIEQLRFELVQQILSVILQHLNLILFKMMLLMKLSIEDRNSESIGRSKQTPNYAIETKYGI